MLILLRVKKNENFVDLCAYSKAFNEKKIFKQDI